MQEFKIECEGVRPRVSTWRLYKLGNLKYYVQELEAAQAFYARFALRLPQILLHDLRRHDLIVPSALFSDFIMQYFSVMLGSCIG
jgi:hypothetical protein